jgi:molybdopterin synthase catalytic subunit
MMADAVRIQTEDFDLTHELAQLRAGNKAVGAVCAFVGTVREWQNPADATHAQADQLAVQGMTLEHYPGMTERAIQDMIAVAHARFDFMSALVIHRIGELATCDQIVLVAVTSAHRGESFKACEFLMDYLKTQAPFWKKESTAQGAIWVDARESDDAALRKWGVVSNNR